MELAIIGMVAAVAYFNEKVVAKRAGTYVKRHRIDWNRYIQDTSSRGISKSEAYKRILKGCYNAKQRPSQFFYEIN